jgi:uncharacterized membrane protein
VTLIIFAHPARSIPAGFRSGTDAIASQPNGRPPRLKSIDILRGLVMVLMALDHVRDFFSNALFDPLNLALTTPALFFTRWITHLCAPVFIFLAGMGAFLYGSHGRTKAEAARFLLIRGLILIVLEFTLVHFGWFFNFEYHFVLAQVIWTIGWSMVALAGLIFLPTRIIGGIGLVMITGHNLFDRVIVDDSGLLEALWIVLHLGGPIQIGPDRELFVLYPLIPWIGVMAAGYALGPLLLHPHAERRRWLLGLWLGLTLIFFALRWTNLYGDPRPWMGQPGLLLTFLSFINTEKYPPSLLFLLMTLGPALLLLAALDRPKQSGPLARALIVFGRAPLFFYVLHLALIHLVAVIFSMVRYGHAIWLIGTGWMFKSGLPGGYGYELPIVYLIWAGVVIILFPACLWFGKIKRLGHETWWSYL